MVAVAESQNPHSASSIAHRTRSHRRRSDRITLQTTHDKRLSCYTSQNRSRLPDDKTLNSPAHLGVSTLPDRAIMLEERVMINLRKAELNRQPSSMYFMCVQTELDPFHREQAVDWAADVCKEMRCQPDILSLAISIFDRYLSHREVFPNELQAVVGVCLLIASKLKAPTPINVDTLVYFSSGAIDADQILSYEISVLLALDWDVVAPTSFDFYDQIVSRLPHISALRSKFIEIIHGILRNHKLATFLPSIQCGLALLCAAKRYSKTFYRDIAGLSSEPMLSVPAVLGVDMNMLLGMMAKVESTLAVDDWDGEAFEFKQGAAGFCSSGTDSGFCSRASTPE